MRKQRPVRAARGGGKDVDARHGAGHDQTHIAYYLTAAKFKAMNLESVLVIAEEIDENLYLASRNLVNVLVVEPRYADPLSLVHYKKVLVTKGAIDQLKEMFA